MTPKENAQELYNEFDNLIRDFTKGVSIKELSKECAILTVNKMLSNAGFIWGGIDNETGRTSRDIYRQYWNDIKKEIEKL